MRSLLSITLVHWGSVEIKLEVWLTLLLLWY